MEAVLHDPAAFIEVESVSPQAGDAVRRTMLERLFRFFDRHRIRYCVLGDTTSLPDRVRSDVDIVVDPAALPLLERKLAAHFADSRGRLVQAIQHEATAWFFVFHREDELGNPVLLQVDVCGDYVRDGRFLVAADEMLGERRIENGFYVASSASEFLYYVVKKLEKHEIDEKHGRHLTAVYRSDPEGVRHRLARFWGSGDARLLEEAAASEEWGDVRTRIGPLRDAFRSRTRARRDRHLPGLRRLVLRLWSRTGLWVAVLGPDGCGKSTVLHHVTAAMAPAFWRTHAFHLRPHLGARGSSTTPVVDPHARPPRGFLSSSMKLFYYAADYSVGYLAVVWPMLVRSTFVVFDRYYHDLLVDPLRFRYAGPRWLAELAVRVLPQPDLFIILDAPVDVLHARKRELPPDETARQRAAYRTIAERLPNAFIVNAAQPLDDVVRSVCRIVADHLARRHAAPGS